MVECLEKRGVERERERERERARASERETHRERETCGRVGGGYSMPEGCILIQEREREIRGGRRGGGARDGDRKERGGERETGGERDSFGARERVAPNFQISDSEIEL